MADLVAITRKLLEDGIFEEHEVESAEELLCKLANEVERLRNDRAWLRRHLGMASHALRSYQYDNGSPELAKETADVIDDLLNQEAK